MPSCVQKLLQWVVALENQHAIRAVCVCAFDFGENTNMPNGINDVAGLLLGILAYDTRQNVIPIISQVPGWNYFTWRIPGIL